jgi:hypothetical protein
MNEIPREQPSKISFWCHVGAKQPGVLGREIPGDFEDGNRLSSNPPQFLQTPLQKLGGVLRYPEHSSKNQGGELRREVGPLN